MGDLQELDGIGDGVEKRLRQQGIESIDELANADPDDINVPTGNVSTLVDRASQATITSKSAADLLDEYENTSYASTGVPTLDDILGGGFESETLATLYGKSGMGKTQVAFSAIAQAIADGPVVYIQTEMQSKSIAQRIADMADDPSHISRVTIYDAFSVSDQYDTYQKVREEHDDLELLVVDSFTAQFRVDEDFEGRAGLGDRATALGHHLRDLGEIARTFDIPIVLTGQVYPQPKAYGKGDKLWGGEKLRHFVSYFVRMANGQGDLVEAHLENHPGRSEEEVDLYINEEGVQTSPSE